MGNKFETNLSKYFKQYSAVHRVTALVFLATSLSGTAGGLPRSQEQKPKQSIRYVYAVFRHGIRSPLYIPYQTDPNKSKYSDYFQGPPGTLTKVGKKMMYRVGGKLKERYRELIKDYAIEKVYMSSTSMSRTIMSALTVAASMFPPSEQIFQNLNWQPVPVWQVIDDFDKSYIYNDHDFPKLGLKDCPRYGKLIEAGYEIIKKPDSTEERQKMYALIQKYTGKNDVNSVNTLYEIWDTLQFESLNGLPLPKWATDPQPDYQGKPLYPDLMQPVMVDWFLYTEYLNNNAEMLDFYSGPMFNSIHEHFLKKTNKPDPPERFKWHASHDTMLFALLWALGLKQPATVGPGDGILFELHEENHNYIVKIFYFDANNKDTVTELTYDKCPHPCTLDKFIETTRGLTPEQWQQRCTV